MINLKRHTNVALTYFLIAALLGIFLRLFFVTPIPANFRYIVHAHSHIALLGWIYLGLTTLIYKLYFSESKKSKIYLRIFWFTQVTLLGMLLTFPFTGYALFSIIFSTLFLIASYFFAWFVFKFVPDKFRSTASYRCIQAALWYMILSSIGPWALGGIMNTLGSTSIWYNLSIYFYLHFQYNGWFILVLLGGLFWFLERRGIYLPEKSFRNFFLLLNFSIILTFFLSVLWTEPSVIFYLLAAIGALLQAWVFIKLFLMLKSEAPGLKAEFSGFTGFILKLTAGLLIFKILMQLISAIPFFADLAFQYNDFVIGYLHWVFLGVISVGLLAFLQHAGLLKMGKIDFGIYFIGFLLSEALIFSKGTALWLGLPVFPDYFSTLLVISGLIPVAIATTLIRNILTEK